ncbi:MAG: hypothetical protein ACR2MA_04055 [Egibacteraceae bacterium]
MMKNDISAVGRSGLALYVWVTRFGAELRGRVADEEGEGVISAAIAVLIMAFLGAAMWVAFNGIFQDATSKIQSNISKIGG